MRLVLVYVLGVCALLALPGLVSAGSACIGISFDVSSADVANTEDKTADCTEATGCASPSVWFKANQAEYRSKFEGVTFTGGNVLFNTGIGKYYNDSKVPYVYAKATGALVGATNATLSDACKTELGLDDAEYAPVAPPPASRRMLLAGSPEWTTDGPFKFTMAYEITGPQPYSANETEVAAADAAKAFKLPVTVTKQGYYCATVTLKVNVEGQKDKIPRLNTTMNSTVNNITVSEKFCFYRQYSEGDLSGKTNLTFDVNTCAEPGYVRLTLSSVSPGPIPLFPEGTQSNNSARLLAPLILINANRIKNLDGTNATQTRADGEPLISIKKFITINSTADLKQYNLSDLLSNVQQSAGAIMAEGIWEVYTRVSVVSEYPSLVDLEGKTPADATAGYPVGTQEYLSTDFNKTEVVVQWNTTYLSAVSSSPKPGTELKGDESITLTWQFTGKGDLTCMHGEEVIANCKSPLVIQPKTLPDSTKTVVVSISFKDSCGTTKKADFSYSKSGVKVLSKVDDPNVLPPEGAVTGTTPGTTQDTTQGTKKNAATLPSALGTLGLGLLSAVAFMAML